ncbi:hypothetical protein GCM10017562_33510 [Streptomyces roseofulvus]
MITEPTTTLAHFFSLVRGVWAHTTYEGSAYRPWHHTSNPRAGHGSPAVRPQVGRASRYAVPTPTYDSLRYA